MHMNQRLARQRRFDQRIARCRDLAQTLAHGQQHVGVAHARSKLRIDADADVARIMIMPIVEQMLMAKCARNGQSRALGEATQSRARFRIPARAACDDQRSLCSGEHLDNGVDLRLRGCDRQRLDAQRIGDIGTRGEHVFRQREHDRSRASRHRNTQSDLPPCSWATASTRVIGGRKARARTWS